MQKQYFMALAGALAFTAGGLRPAAAALPTGFSEKDIGSPTPAGSAAYDDKTGVLTIKGGGDDIWNSADNFHYVYQKATGDVTITAQYLSMTPGDAAWTKSGPMIRAADTDSSSHAELVVTSANNTVMQGRPTDGAGSTNPFAYPLSMSQQGFLRLQRAGNDVIGYASQDGGVTWIQVGDYPLTELQKDALVGIALTSHQDGTEASAKFDHLKVDAGASLVYGITSCGADKAVMLSWSALKGAASYNLYRAPAGETDVTKFTLVNNKAVTGTSFTDSATDLVNGKRYTYLIVPVTNDANGKPVEGGRAAITGGPFVQSPPAGYTVTSIDENKVCGTGVSFDAATGIITIRGSGNDLWNNSDNGNFTSQPVTGNFQVTVTALNIPSRTSDWSKSGLMIREDLEAGSRDAYLVTTGNNGLTFQYRDTKDGGAAWPGTAEIAAADLPAKLPIMLRMTRKGDDITPEYSTDGGKTWTKGDDTFTLTGLAKTVHVGLVITSHETGGQIAESQFKDLVIKPL